MQNLPIMYSYENYPMVAQDVELESMAEKLRESVTFLPLKDLRYVDNATQGHTWFMSSLNDTHAEGEVQYQYFPSEPSKGRVLCLKGRDTHDGSRNYYALAWWEFLPRNATAVKGLTFVSYNHYNYDNIWHGLSATLPFVAWYQREGCQSPDRWILYHWGEIRQRMSMWLGKLMEATFGGFPVIEYFDGVEEGSPVCLEKVVVMRHNEGGMSLQRRMEAYDLMRCRARSYCNVSSKGRRRKIQLTMFMRTGPRSFRNDSLVIEIFRKACAMFKECRLAVAYSHNLTFCEQVKLMSRTDILVSPHGAQLTNMFLMDRNSSVMEFFPKGWLELAGVGQYVYHWIASWSGMRHEGAWRDPKGDTCPYQEDKHRCMSYYKSGRIGHDETHFTEWARKVVNEVRSRKRDAKYSDSSSVGCTCGKTSRTPPSVSR
ncbi:hypothetical protein MLD38_023224 [Melastoma candidum]|uniref:Uncharacterized protein n=1 Tax=Melastoma candidum TaxID=119954 RepID=A0ACB9QMD3_9MYRT|nr:hypothetical protein MLD38_023224 [Melastoma candidum]